MKLNRLFLAAILLAATPILAQSQESVVQSVKVGLLKADITETNSELVANPGWHQCWVLKDPAIKIFATKNVSKSAIDAVAVICDQMVKSLAPDLDKEKSPGKRFDGFKVYITNQELGEDLKALSGVKDYWKDGSGPGGRDDILGGGGKPSLWVTEQAICKTGIKTKAAIGKPEDTNTRTFDQVVHEFAHSIDYNFNVVNTDNNQTIFNSSIGPFEGFAIATQSWFGTPKGDLTPDQNSRLGRIFKSRVTFSAEGYAGEINLGGAIMKMAAVPKGSFWMGGGSGKVGTVQQEVGEFYIGTHEVTQAQWKAVMGAGSDSSKFKGDDLPVETVSWNDAQKFIEALNKKTKGSGYVYRLPTAVEWEYACRGGAVSQEESAFDFYFDKPTNDLSSDQANFDGNSPAGNGAKSKSLGKTVNVGSYKSNKLGLYDMHGNVWEWTDTLGGSSRVIRGAHWGDTAQSCKAASLATTAPGDKNENLGFRIAASRK